MTAPNKPISKLPNAKLRFLKMLRFTIGFLARNSRMRKAIKPATMIAAAQRIHVAENQSSSCPLSKMICSAPIQIASNPRPMLSILPLGGLDVWRVFDEAQNHEHRKNSDGHVDVKGPAPGVLIGEPAAEGGAKNRCNDYAKTEQGHGHATLGGRKTFEKNCLGQRLQCAASGALNRA